MAIIKAAYGVNDGQRMASCDDEIQAVMKKHCGESFAHGIGANGDFFITGHFSDMDDARFNAADELIERGYLVISGGWCLKHTGRAKTELAA